MIETGAIQKLGCGFLFAFYSNNGRICSRLWKIFSVKEWRDLENRVRVCSKSLEMAPFDRSRTSSYSPSIVTIAIFCIVSEIYRLIGKKARNFHTSPAFNAPAGGDPVGISWRRLMLVNLEWLGYRYRMLKKLLRHVKPFSSDTGTSRTDRQTDGQTDFLFQCRASVCWRAKKNRPILMKFDALQQILNPMTLRWPKLQIFRVQDGVRRRPPYWKPFLNRLIVIR